MQKRQTDPEGRKAPSPLYRAWEFYFALLRRSVALVEIGMCRNEHASDCLFGFALEFDGLPAMTAVAKDGLPVVVGTPVCKGLLEIR